MIAQRLKKLRSENNLTQVQLANILGIAKTTLAAYEQGKSEPNITLLIEMANYFGVTVDYLIGKSNCINSKNQPISDALGIDEKTIEVLLTLYSSNCKISNLDILEAIMQHPQFTNLLNNIRSYIIKDKNGWVDISIRDNEGNVFNTISAEIVKASSMQLIQTSFKGIIDSISYSKHFSAKK